MENCTLETPPRSTAGKHGKHRIGRLYWGAPYPIQSACTWAYESYVDDLFARVNAEWVAHRAGGDTA